MKKQENKINVEEEVIEKVEENFLIERFIYVTTYDDSEHLKIIKEIFEDYNPRAFNLKSIKEIYTKSLTKEEQNNLELDFISGFQIIDSKMRITILEGLSNGVMKIVKERLPKTDVNNQKKRIYTSSNILFSKRIYSYFNLCLKFIKLRDTLENIISTFDIYLKKTKYESIFDCFMKLGSIIKSPSMEFIQHAELFPLSESLVLVERKYADILNNEDLDGIKREKKKKINKKDKKLENISKDLDNTDKSKILLTNSNNDLNLKTQSNSKNDLINSSNNNLIKIENQNEKASSKSVSKIRLKAIIYTHNENFDKSVLSRSLVKIDHHSKNLDFLKSLTFKSKKSEHFCKNEIIETKESNPVYLYSQQKKNYFDNYADELRSKFSKDKKNYYTYSNQYLTLSFPMINMNRNQNFDNYVENKKKWIIKKDFDRYKDKKEYVYFPKISNQL